MFRKNKNTSQLLGVGVAEEGQKPSKKARKKKEPFSLGKFFRNRVAMAIFCIVIAFVFAFVLVPILELQISQTTTVVCANADIRIGEILTADKLQLVEVGSFNLPVDVIKSISDVEGQYANAEMMNGDYVLAKKVSDSYVSDDAYLLNLPSGKMAMSVEVNGLAESLSGKLRQGDIVRLFTLLDNDEAVSPGELQYVEVLAVTNSNVNDVTNGINNIPDIDSVDKEIKTVTLAVNNTQAVALTALPTVHFTLVYRGDVETRNIMLEEQDKYIQGLAKE